MVLSCQGNAMMWFYVTAPAGVTYQQIKAAVRIRVGLLCRAAAEPLTHWELMEGLLPKYPQMDTDRAESALPSRGTFWELRTPCWRAELEGSSADVNGGNYTGAESPGRNRGLFPWKTLHQSKAAFSRTTSPHQNGIEYILLQK